MAGWLNQIFCLVVIGGLIQFLLGQRLCLPHICKIQNTWVQKVPFHYICTLFALISQIIPFPSHVLEALYYVQNCIIVLVVSHCCLKIWISFICYQKISWPVMCLPNPRLKCYLDNREICTWSTFMYIELVDENDGAFVYAHRRDGNAILKSWKSNGSSS